MQIEKHNHSSSSKLILCFAGWSASPELFRHLTAPDHSDVWIAFDYRDTSFTEDLSHYSEIHLVAWSLGVWVAAHCLSRQTSITTATAINGTLCPIHARWGIPPPLFEQTLQQVSEEGMRRFNRRICGDRESFRRYELLPKRTAESLKEELAFLHKQILCEEGVEDISEATWRWSHALVSKQDRIFPPEHMRNFWQDRCPIVEIDAAHQPFFLYQTWEEVWK